MAVSEGLWDNGAACGRRYRLSCLSGNNRPCKGDTIDVRVVDFCPKKPCPSTILLSKDAFSQISHSPHAKINIEYIQYVQYFHLSILLSFAWDRYNHVLYVFELFVPTYILTYTTSTISKIYIVAPSQSTNTNINQHYKLLHNNYLEFIPILVPRL